MFKKIILTICFVCFFYLQSCTAKDLQLKTDFPEEEDIFAVAIYLAGNRLDDANLFDVNGICPFIMLIGDKKKAEESIGIPLKPWKLIESTDWVDRIVNEYDSALSKAQDKNLYQPGDLLLSYRIVFITKNSIHVRYFDFYDKFFFEGLEEKMKSEKLKIYFEELGLIPKITISAREEYFIPPKEETIAIMIWPFVSGSENPYPPVAIFGDKEQAEKLLYGDKTLVERMFRKSLEPNKVFNGRSLLEEIWDIYASGIKEDSENGDKIIFHLVNNGNIVFITETNAYKRSFLFDVNNCRVVDDSFSSEELWSLFEELELVDLLQESDYPDFKERIKISWQQYNDHLSQKNPEQ